MKGHPHAGHMGTQRITLQGVKLVDILKREGEELFVFK
jgi:ribosomal protein L3